MCLGDAASSMSCLFDMDLLMIVSSADMSSVPSASRMSVTVSGSSTSSDMSRPEVDDEGGERSDSPPGVDGARGRERAATFSSRRTGREKTSGVRERSFGVVPPLPKADPGVFGCAFVRTPSGARGEEGGASIVTERVGTASTIRRQKQAGAPAGGASDHRTAVCGLNYHPF